MARKAVSIPARAIETPDDFVNRRAPTPEKPEMPVIRLSVDLPEDVHIKLKMRCAARRQKMGEAVRAMIERDLAEAA
jgi:hypothetical protein